MTKEFISNDQTKTSGNVQDIKEFNSQSPATQVKKGEQLVKMMPAFEEAWVMI